MQEISFPSFDNIVHEDAVASHFAAQEMAPGPSLPAILLSATFGIVSAGLGFYVCYRVLDFDVLFSAVMAAICLFLLFGPLGILASLLAGSPALPQNVGYGCGLTLVALMFFAMCAALGAMAALIAMQMGLVVS